MGKPDRGLRKAKTKKATAPGDCITGRTDGDILQAKGQPKSFDVDTED